MHSIRYILAAALLLAFQIAHSECRVDSARTESATNKDQSIVSSITTICDDGGSEKVVYEKNGKRTELLHTNGLHPTTFYDLNNDGFHEIFVRDTCGTVNCDEIIYSVDPINPKARQVLRVNNMGIERVGNFFVATERIRGAGEYKQYGFEIRNFSRLDVGQNPSFTIHPKYDEKTGKDVCNVSIGTARSNEIRTRQLIKRYCPKGFAVKMGKL